VAAIAESSAVLAQRPLVFIVVDDEGNINSSLEPSPSPSSSKSWSLVSTSYEVARTLNRFSPAGALVHPIFHTPIQYIDIKTTSAMP